MLKEYRKRANMSQEELERITNVDRKTIFRIEKGINLPLLDTFAKLAIALDMSDEEIANVVKMAIDKKKKNREDVMQ